MKIKMNLYEEGNELTDLPEWYNPHYMMYKFDQDSIDFFKVYDDFNQTKLKLFTLNISYSGWSSAISKSSIKIVRLCYIYNDRNPSEQELIDKAILKLEEETKVYRERRTEIAVAIEETKAKFLYLKNEYKDDYNLKMGLSEPLSDNEKLEKIKVSFKSNSPCEPFNDPYDQFGWKSYYDLKNQISTEYAKRIDDYRSDEELRRFQQYGDVRTEDLPLSYFRERDAQNVVGDLILERDYKINKALLGLCQKYFKEDLSQPIYDGLAYFLD